jgi:hypothetical protein
LHKIFRGDNIKEDDMVRHVAQMGKMINVSVSVTSLRKEGMRTGLKSYLRIGSNGRLL